LIFASPHALSASSIFVPGDRPAYFPAGGVAGPDARISWTLPETCSDGTPIAPEDIRKIVVTVYAGPARDGPWRWIATSEPGGTPATVPAPVPRQEGESVATEHAVTLNKTPTPKVDHFKLPFPDVLFIPSRCLCPNCDPNKKVLALHDGGTDCGKPSTRY